MSSSQITSISKPGIMVFVLITVDPSKVDELLKHLWVIYKHVTAEPESSFFEVNLKRETGEIRLTERWHCTVDWFERVQLKKKYYQPYLEATEPMWTKPRVIEYFECLSPEWTTIKPVDSATYST
ncbi:hypothetical protein K435DRAFT_676388 [Dendrothele bispora CBS 962.96]|uniref:ABM domain-containing protein n=1 Tax=Dendrothele bispora (strain CBS 962.96) TaxID=1314807 RepID=A0A4S8LMM7_DENBC|nr:hypothetical protein K435DRAFT_676388 [Dendrothele bispora CBS 962.96]